MSCASMHQSWSEVEAEEVEWRWRRRSGGRGSRRWLEVGGEGEGRSYHDSTTSSLQFTVMGVMVIPWHHHVLCSRPLCVLAHATVISINIPLCITTSVLPIMQIHLDPTVVH